jgi:hypothetical protein
MSASFCPISSFFFFFFYLQQQHQHPLKAEKKRETTFHLGGRACSCSESLSVFSAHPRAISVGEPWRPCNSKVGTRFALLYRHVLNINLPCESLVSALRLFYCIITYSHHQQKNLPQIIIVNENYNKHMTMNEKIQIMYACSN